MGKHIPFLKGLKTEKDDEGGIVVDKGQLDKLEYRVYSRGVIHILDGQGNIFKKDPDIFEDELNKALTNIQKLEKGKQIVITGSGDNDNLVFQNSNGKISIKLESKKLNIIEKLKNVIGIGKDYKQTSIEKPKIDDGKGGKS